MSTPAHPWDVDLDSCECPHCYADAFRKKGTGDDFTCAGCRHRFPWVERSARLTPYGSRLIAEIAAQAEIIDRASIARDGLIRQALRAHMRPEVVARAAGVTVETVEKILARM